MSTDALITISGPAMGARWTASLPSSAPTSDLEISLAEVVDRVNLQMSTWRDDSDLMRLNRAPLGAWQDIPEDLMFVLRASLQMTDQSDGLFDISVGRLVEAWGFGPAQGKADPEEIRLHLGRRCKGRRALELDPLRGQARRLSDVSLDLSGIAKGYAVDLMADTLSAAGVNGFLTGLDGEMRAKGLRPDGQRWAVAIEEPSRRDRSARALIEVTDCAVATSGDYRHFLQIAAGYVSHSMNPRNGGPVQNWLGSVTVLADTCWQADAWATVLMVLGENAGPPFAAAQNLEAIFYIREGEKIIEVITRGGQIFRDPPQAAASGAQLAYRI